MALCSSYEVTFDGQTLALPDTTILESEPVFGNDYARQVVEKIRGATPEFIDRGQFTNAFAIAVYKTDHASIEAARLYQITRPAVFDYDPHDLEIDFGALGTQTMTAVLDPGFPRVDLLGDSTTITRYQFTGGLWS